MKFVRYEWKKIFTGKIWWIFLVIFCLNLGAYYIYMIPSMSVNEEYKIQQNQMTVQEYHQFIDGLKERAEYMKGISIFNKEDGFSQRNIEKTVKDFTRVESIKIHPMDDTGMEKLHQFYLTDVLLILFTCLLCFQQYGNDSKSGMGELIQGTPNGKSRLRFAQIQAVGVGVMIGGVLLHGTNILVTDVTIGLGNLSYYVQGMSMFRTVSFPCTVGEYLLLFICWKFLTLLFISLVFQLFAVWFNGKHVSWILSGAILVISFMLWFFLPDSPVAKLFRYLNLIGLLDVGKIIGSYQNLNVFQHPVLLLHAAIIFIIAGGSVLMTAILLVKRLEIGRWNIVFPVRKHRKMWKHVFTYEFHKVVIHQRVWMILAVLFAVSVLYAGPGQPHVSVTEYYYENYVKEYEGDYSDKKAKEIKEIWKKQQFTDAYEKDGFELLYQQSKYLKGLKNSNKGYVNRRIFGELFLNEQQDTKNMLFIVITVLLSVSGLFYQDRKKQMQQLLCVTPKEGAVYWNKMILSAMLGGVSSLIVWGIVYIKYFFQYDVEGLGFSIRSMPEFAKNQYGGSVLSWIIIAMLLRILIGMYMGVLLGFLAQIFPVPTQNMICGILVFIFPLCMCYIGQMGYLENPFISFINQYLLPVLQPIKMLASFPTVCFLTDVWKLLLFAGIPFVCTYIGSRMWENKKILYFINI